MRGKGWSLRLRAGERGGAKAGAFAYARGKEEGQRLEPSLTRGGKEEGQRLEPSLTRGGKEEGQRLEPSLTRGGRGEAKAGAFAYVGCDGKKNRWQCFTRPIGRGLP
jgi:hypothetical protein